eukprot:scaffold87016_cov54-Cyclotella_meneghiniana.AAC.3
MTLAAIASVSRRHAVGAFSSRRYLPRNSSILLAPNQRVNNMGSPPGPLQRWECTWEEKHLGIEQDFELRGMELRRLLRLRPDYKDEEGSWHPETRVEFMTIAAREPLRGGYCQVVGGFIRDWIIRGEIDQVAGTPKDIDLRLWEGFDMDGYIKRCESWGLSLDDRGLASGHQA